MDEIVIVNLGGFLLPSPVLTIPSPALTIPSPALIIPFPPVNKFPNKLAPNVSFFSFIFNCFTNSF